LSECIIRRLYTLHAMHKIQSLNQKIEKDYYDRDFYNLLHDYAQQSAEVIVPLILEIIRCERVIDVGCGDGTWLKVFQENGVKEILGVDGSYVDEQILVIPKENFIPHDLKQPLKIANKLDLAMSLEVAEHLPTDCAELFVDSLANLSSVILFSAAIPNQGGENHINEQWQDYWAEKFQERGYIAFDYIRPKIWNTSQVAYWYRQNILLFVESSYLKENPFLQNKLQSYEVKDISSLSVIHPALYLIKIGAISWEDVHNLDLSLPTKKEINNSNQIKNHPGILSRLKRIINTFKRENEL